MATPTGGSRRGGCSIRRTARTRRRRSWPTPASTSSCRTATAIRSTPTRSAPRASSPTTPTTCWWWRPATRSATVSRSASAMTAGNLTTQGNDYRVLQPRLVTDPNRNRTAVAFDALGMVVGTAVMGKPLPAPVEGDSLDGFEADLTEAVILDHLADPLADPQAILGRATTRLVYDLFAYQRTKNQPDPQPAVVYTLARETHDSDPGASRRTEDPAQLRLLRRLRPRDPEEDPGRARAGAPARCQRQDHRRRGRPAGDDAERRQPALGRQRLDGLQQQGQAGPPVRAVLHRHAPLRVRRAHRRQPGALLRPGRARRRDAAPQSHLGEGGLRPVAAGDLGRQRHRAGGRSQDRSRRRRLLQPPARTPTICRPGTPQRQRRRASGPRANRPRRRKAASPRRRRRPSPTSTRSAAPSSPSRTTGSSTATRPRRLCPPRSSTTPASSLDIEGNQREVRDAIEQAGDPLGASSCATTTTCSATASTRPAWRRASAGC